MRILRNLLIIPFLLCQSLAVLASLGRTPSAPDLDARSYILLDYNSGRIIANNNSDMKVEPASLTKMMTMYVVDNEIKQGKLNLNDTVLVSKNAWQAPGSRMFLEVGSRVSVSELIKGIIIQSGNDASVAIAEHIAGSEQAFVEIMNGYAEILGMKNTNFKNATGLPSKNHLSTARDMSKLASALIREFPETYKLYSEKEYTYHGIRQHNRNRLLWRNNYVDGIKTGQTDRAGYCLVASGKMDNMRLISVVMGTKSDKARTNESNRLLSWGFRFFETKKIYQKNIAVHDTKVYLGENKNMSLGIKEDLYVTVPAGKYDSLKAAIELPTVVRAPLKKGDIVGVYRIEDEENNTIAERELIALDNVEKGGVISYLKDMAALSIKSVVDKINPK